MIAEVRTLSELDGRLAGERTAQSGIALEPDVERNHGRIIAHERLNEGERASGEPGAVR